MNNRHYGLTLLEVLIASVILFTTLTVFTESYRTNLSAINKSTATIDLIAPVQLIVDRVARELRPTSNAVISGRGEILGVSYVFEARSVEASPPLRRFDPESGVLVEYDTRYHLYAVNLRVMKGGAERIYQYREIGWAPTLDLKASR